MLADPYISFSNGLGALLSALQATPSSPKTATTVELDYTTPPPQPSARSDAASCLQVAVIVKVSRTPTVGAVAMREHSV
jgi:hypothetical protein